MATLPDESSDIQPREQADTCISNVRSVVSSREFARGLAEVRSNLPFNADDDDWGYERGRAFDLIAPLNLPLRQTLNEVLT